MSFERHEGRIHDRIVVLGDEREYVGDVTVLAGDDEADTVSVLAHSLLIHASFSLKAEQAVTLGRLLVAAGEDTLSRPRPTSDTGTDETEAP